MTHPEQPDEDHGLDMVPFFRSSAHDAEQEALWIHSVLEANGISSVVVGPSVIPTLEFQVQVPLALAADAEAALAEARAAGPAAALEAEKASEDAV